jgi:hypothetical protein
LMILPNGPEMYLPPRIFDKVTDRLALKPKMTVGKPKFKAPDNTKCPKNSFIISSIMKFRFGVKKSMEDTKMVYDRDGGNGAPPVEEEDEDEDMGDEE